MCEPPDDERKLIITNDKRGIEEAKEWLRKHKKKKSIFNAIKSALAHLHP